MKRWQRRVRRWLCAQPVARASVATVWRERRRQILAATTLVRVLYVCLFAILLQLYPSWGSWLKLDSIDLLWPIGWFRWTGVHAGVGIVIFGSLLAALLAAALPTVRICRALAAIGVLCFAAFFNSFGSTNHGWHAWIWTMIVLVFLPDGATDQLMESTARGQRFLRVVWAALALNLLFYSMSGGFKLVGAAAQIAHGQVNAFSPEALARHTAYRLLEGAATADYMWGPFVIRHPYAGWPFYVGALYLESMTVFVAFRPALHRVWGVLLILFHLGIHLTLTIMFGWQMFLIGLLLLASPFAPTRNDSRMVVRSLPVIGDLLSLRAARRGAR